MSHYSMLLFVFGALIVGCGASPCPHATLNYEELTPEGQYEIAHAIMTGSQDSLVAVALFERLRADYPYSRYSALAELRIADCYAAERRDSDAIRAYGAFLERYPLHPDVSYAQTALSRLRREPSDHGEGEAVPPRG